MATFKNSAFLFGAQQFFVAFVFFLLILQLHFLNASTVGDVTEFQEQPKQSAEAIKKLSRFGSLYRSSGELSDDRTLFESLFEGKQATVPLHLDVNSEMTGKAKKLISWIRRQSLQDSSLEDADKTDAPENRGAAKAGLPKMAKRVMNCKPLKEQFKEFRGEVFKKGDNSFKNNLRDFLANCNNNDGIRF